VAQQGGADPTRDSGGRFNRQDPELDGELLLDTVTRVEYEALLLEPAEIDGDHIRKLLRRQIGWALGVKRA
jgi:hypothetical protein